MSDGEKIARAMPGRVDALLCAAVVTLVAMLPFLEGIGGAFGFPGAAVWLLVVGPVALMLLAGGGGTDDPGEPDA